MTTDKKTLEVREWVRTQVSPYRFQHIEGVAKTAKSLAQKHHLPPRKAEWAALLHDCAKELSRAEMKRWIKKGGFKLDKAEEAMPGLWHPHAGAALAKLKWGIKDKDILEAIRCHTLGGAGMGPLARLLFVADFIEPGRRFRGVEVVRRAADSDLAEAVLLKCSMTLQFLFEKGMKVHPRLVETWNSHLKSNKMPE